MTLPVPPDEGVRGNVASSRPHRVQKTRLKPIDTVVNKVVLHSWLNLAMANRPKHSWNVHLIQEGNVLKYSLEHRQNHKIREGMIDVPLNVPLKVFADVLIEHFEPMVEVKKSVCFSEKLWEYQLPSSLQKETIKVRLLRGKTQLFWQKLEPLYYTRTYIPICLTFGSLRCSSSTQKSLQYISRWTPGKEQISDLAKYRCANFTIESLNKLLHICAKPLPEKTFSFDRLCKCKILVCQDGRIKFIFENYDKLPKNDELKGFNFKNKICLYPDLRPFFTEENGKTLCFFLTQKQAQQTPWKDASQPYTYQLFDPFAGEEEFQVVSDSKEQFVCELIPQISMQTVPYQISCEVNITGFATIESNYSCIEKRGNPPFDEYVDVMYYNGFLNPNFSISFPTDRHIPIHLSEITTIQLEPIFACSYFDGTVPITPDRWAFTLIAGRGKDDNHAAGVIEMMNDGTFKEYEKNAYVKFFFDFTGGEIRALFKDEIQFDERSKVIPLKADNAKFIIRKVLSARRRRPPSFDLRGIDAIGSKGHSCFTWLREMVSKGGIELGNSFWGFIATRTKFFTEKSHISQNEQL